MKKTSLIFLIFVIFSIVAVPFIVVNASVISLTYETTNPTRTPDDAWENTQVNEQSDFYYGEEYISWYRGNGGGTYEVGFENSTDGISWTPYSGNPIISSVACYVYTVKDGDCFYIFVNNGTDANGWGNIYLYNVTDYTNPVIMNGGNPVYTSSSTASDWDHRIFNPGVTIGPDGTWHMLLEGKSSTSGFKIGYAYSNLTEMNWTAHRTSSYVIDTAGNPFLVYVPDFNSLLSLHGDISSGTWIITSSYASLSDNLTQASSWKNSSNFTIEQSGIHIADPSMMNNFNATYPTMISYNYNQVHTYQAYSELTLNEFFSNVSGQSNAEATWWNTDWSYYKQCNVSNKLDDYQMKLIVGNSTGGNVTCSGHCQGDFGDIRFTDSDNNTISYWMENHTADTQATFWINNSANSSSINIYYGTSGTSTTTSNGTNTFLFFDNFSSSIDWTNDWQSSDQSEYSVSGGNLVMQPLGLASHANVINSITKFSNGRSFHARGKTTAGEVHFNSEDSTGAATGKEQLSIRIGDTYVAYIGGAYTTAGTGVADTWFKFKINILPGSTSGAYLYSDDESTLIVSKTGTPTYASGYIAMEQWTNSGLCYIDWIFVKLYNSPEPSWSSFGSEQTKPAGATVPTVTTNDATGVEETNATIRGTLTNNGSAGTTCWFRYGDETPPIDNNISQGIIAHGASFSYNWQSLTPGELYYFDTQANNSEGWDTTGGINSFLTKPNATTGASCSAGDGWTNVSWTAATGADKYLVRYKSGSAPTSVTDGTLFDNVTVLYINKSAGAGTHYFSIWSYAYESSPALQRYSDAYDSTSGTETLTTWRSSSFGGSVTVDPTGWSNTAPTVECNSTGSFPANQSTDISLQPTVAAWVNDTDGNQSTVYFYNSTDGSTWTLQQTNLTVLNETVTYAYTEASSYSTKYYWKVSANDTHDNTSAIFEFTTESGPTWHSLSFGGSVTVGPSIDVEINDSSWIAGSLDCGDDVQKNFTFYQNGSATIDITIGINSTNGNYSFVNYTTWSSNGHDQYCANFTVDTWSSESMIEPDYPASSVLKSSFAPGNFVYGIRLWMPKSVTYQDRQEDFEVVLYVSEST